MVKFKNTFISIVILFIILIVSGIIIGYGRGYRFDITKKTIGSTGLISVTSDPTGAHIYIDNKKIGATNTNISVKPGWYTITISKEGYQSWEKKIRVQGEVVGRADAVLFPTNPSLSAISASGVAHPVLSPDGMKLAYTIPTPTHVATNGADLAEKAGVWVLDLIDKPLGFNRDARQIIKAETLDTNDATFTWSPDSKQLLIDIPINQVSTVSYLADTDKLNTTVTPVSLRSEIMHDWTTQHQLKEQEKLSTLAPDFLSVATSSMRIISFSPDERNILYEATAAATIPTIIDPPLLGANSTPEVRSIKPYSIYTYDIKEDKNYLIAEAKDVSLQWLPSSRHILTVGDDKIDVFDYDGTNRRTVYAGPFLDAFVAPWSNASKLVVVTNLNSTASTLPNLYAINIK